MRTVQLLQKFYQESKTPAQIDEKTLNVFPATAKLTKISRTIMLVLAILMIIMALLLQTQKVTEGVIVCGVLGVLFLGLYIYMGKALNTTYILDKSSGKAYSKFKNQAPKEIGNLSEIKRIYDYDTRQKGVYTDTTVYMELPGKTIKIARYYDPAITESFRKGFIDAINNWLHS